MNIPDNEQWLKRARKHMKRRGHGDEWLAALKNRFQNGPDQATNAEVAEEIAAYLSNEKAATGAETIEKALDAESNNERGSSRTEAASDDASDGSEDGIDLERAFDPDAEPLGVDL